jgi:MFS transporter, MHS family, alpha-ketoglutarate permease
LISLLVYVFMGESSRRSQLERETRELRSDKPERAKVDEVVADSV